MGADAASVLAQLEYAKTGTLLAADAARGVLFCDARPCEGMDVRRTLALDARAGRIEPACLRPWLREQGTPGVLRVVVNEGAGPYLCRPAQMGADVVVEDLGDLFGPVLAGVACVCARNDEVLARFLELAGVAGGAPDVAFDVTVNQVLGLLVGQLSLVSQARCDRALVAAQYLAHHPAVSEVAYPGLGDDPGNPEARRSLEHGFGWRVCFRLRDSQPRFEQGLWDVPHAGISSRVERLACGAYVLHAGLEEPLDVVGALEKGIACMQSPAETHNVAHTCP